MVRLRRRARAVTELMVPALLADMFGDPQSNPKGWPVLKLGELLDGIDSGKSPRCHDRPKAENEWGVLRLSALKNGLYEESDHKTLPETELPDTRSEVQTGDLLISRKNTLELVGTPAYVWETRGRILLPDLIFRLRLRPDAGVHPLYLWALLRAPGMRRGVQLLASGTAASMPNISKERLRTLRVMVPSAQLQEAFAQRVAALHAIAVQQDAALTHAKSTFEALLARAFGPESQPREAGCTPRFPARRRAAGSPRRWPRRHAGSACAPRHRPCPSTAPRSGTRAEPRFAGTARSPCSRHPVATWTPARRGCLSRARRPRV
jgi:type I restriction enzyme S subunit